MDVSMKDNSKKIKSELKDALERALEKVGMAGEGYAKRLCPSDTGRLRNSITHITSGKDVYIGTNTEYAVYVEMGTGIYFPGGRKTPWFYLDDEGRGHITSGSPARPFLKPAATEHASTYRSIIEQELKG